MWWRRWRPLQPRRVRFSPIDPRRLLVLEASGLVGVWDVSVPAEPVLFAALTAGAIDAAFSPDGGAIVTAGVDGRVRWWTADGQLAWKSNGNHTGAARSVAVASDMVVSGGEDGALRLWTTRGSPLGEPLQAHTAAVVAVDVSPQGNLISVAGDGTARLWTQTETAPAPRYRSMILAQRRKPPGAQTFLNMLRLDSSWGWHRSAAFSPRGDFSAGTVLDGALQVWNADGSLRVRVADAHRKRHVYAVAFSPDGDLIASAGFDGTVRLWNFDGSPRGAPIGAHYNQVFAVSVAADAGTLATCGADDRVRLWRLDGSRVAELPHRARQQVTALAVSPREPVLAVATGMRSVRLWRFDGTPAWQPPEQQPGARSLAFAPDGQVLASRDGAGTVRLWSRDGLIPVSLPSGKPSAMMPIAYAPDGKTLATGSEALVLWNPTGVLWQAPADPPDVINTIAFSPRGDVLATGSLLGRLQVWGRDGSTRAGPLKLPKENVRAVAFSPDGKLIASTGGDERFIRLWRPDLSEREPPLEGHADVVRVLAFAPTGTLLASGSRDGTVRIWHLPARDAEVIDVGVPVDDLGFWRDFLWVRADGDSLFFFDGKRQPRGSAHLRDDTILTTTPDGWYAGSNLPQRFVRVFGESGAELTGAAARQRLSPAHVLAALGGG